MKTVQEWLGHSTFSTTADIYSCLNFSSKLGIADSLSDILTEKTSFKWQATPDTIETMQKIFRATEIEKPANENHLQAFEVFDKKNPNVMNVDNSGTKIKCHKEVILMV